MNALLLVVVLKGLVEVCLLCFAAQGILFAFAGSRRNDNAIYRLFAFINRPILKATRVVTPRFIVDAHVGLVAFFLLCVAWVLLLAAKVYYTLQVSVPPA